MTELKKIDLITELAFLSSHLALLRDGHLDAAVYIMAYAGQKYNSRLVYDPSYPEIDLGIFRNCDWSEFNWDAEEAVPMNVPEQIGKGVDILMFVESALLTLGSMSGSVLILGLLLTCKLEDCIFLYLHDFPIAGASPPMMKQKGS